MSDAWDSWERLRQNPEADAIEVLRAVSAFQKYFAAIEKEAVKLARSQDHTWQEIGNALGRTRQAVWQQRAADQDAPKFEAIGQRIENSWAMSAEVRHNIGLRI